MKAVYIEAQGGPDVLTYGERPDPIIEPHEVKLRVRACALNRLDVWTRSGLRGTRREFKEPLILGCDTAGDVAEVGSEVRSVQVGDRVMLNPVIHCGQCSHCLVGKQDMCDQRQMLGTMLNGGYAEYVKAPAANAFKLPDSVGYEEAAAVPTTFMPVWNMMVRRAQLKPWETVLVLSASSGVGTAAIEVAKGVVGARVITTTSTPEKALIAREIGADEVILYNEEDVAKRVAELTGNKGVDMVVDHVGTDFWEAAFGSLARGGRYGVCGVTTGYRAQLHMGQLFSKQLTLFGVSMGSMEDLREILDALGRGRIHARISQTFPLSQAAEAHKAMEERTFFGKLLLTVR